MARFTTSAATALALLLTGCGGGGGSSGPPASTPNTAPTITSPSTVSAPENVAAFYTVTVSDAEGGPIAFSIGEGNDGAAFQIDNTGKLSFRTGPNFEVPKDSDGDNVYLVTVIARDSGGLETSLALTVTVTDVTSGGFRVRRVASGYTQPVYLSAVPGDPAHLAVVEKRGIVRLVDSQTFAEGSTPFLDVSAQTTTDGQRGLMSIAFAPDYATSRKAYIFMSNKVGDIEIRRYTATALADRLDPATADVIMRIPHSSSNLNYGGWIGFDERNRFYVTVGDANDCPGPLTTRTAYKDCNAWFGRNFLGSVLRVDVSTDAFPDDPDRDYGPDNRGNIRFIYGVRNPYRASIDRIPRKINNFRHYFWFGDIGQSHQEEISHIGTDASVINNIDDFYNFGWPYYEGTYREIFDNDQKGTQRPIAYYEHGTGASGAKAVVGGYYYYDGPVESLVKEYIFGDFASGQIFSYTFDQYNSLRRPEVARERTAEFKPVNGTIDHITSFGLDLAGNLYIVDLDGEVYIVEPA